MQKSILSFGDVQQQSACLDAKLLPHQSLHAEAAVQNKAILIGDEAGMGKSLIALKAIEASNAYPALILTPASAVDSLLNECRKWLPWRTSQKLGESLPNSEIIVMNYEMLVPFQHDLVRLRPKAVVVDESHYVKEESAKRSQITRMVTRRAQLRILMSATIVKNTCRDILHQLIVLDRHMEVIRYAHQLEGKDMPVIEFKKDLTAAFNAVDKNSLHRALIDLGILHRTTHVKAKTGLNTVQRFYVKCGTARDLEYERLEQEFLAYCKETARLKLLDNKVERAKATIKAAGHIGKMRQALGAAKVGRTVRWAEALRKKGRKGLVFCYHKHVAHELQALLPGKVLMITGDIPIKKRQPIVDQFADADFLVATLDSLAHGVNGLHLHTQSTAHVELDYTSSKHIQAEGRLRRHGQKERVQAYYLVAPNTIDEALLATIRTKYRNAAIVLDGKNSLKHGNFAEKILVGIIAQRPWETGKRIDWKDAIGRLKVGMPVRRLGRRGGPTGQVVWVNRTQTSCQVEWPGSPAVYEVPGTLQQVRNEEPAAEAA
jgi:SWI/SNF-related matrix-associated actin-dependent regulator 1 of chromatin subfamily A